MHGSKGLNPGSVHVVSFQLVWLSFKLCPLRWAATVPAHSQQMVTQSSPLDACVLHYYITVPNAVRLAGDWDWNTGMLFSVFAIDPNMLVCMKSSPKNPA